MKTNVIARTYHGGYERLIPANISNAERHHVISFRVKHKVSGSRIVSLDTFKTKPFTEIEPDSLHTPTERKEFKRGVCESVHVISDEYVAQLADMDDRIEALCRERNELIEEAYRNCRAVRIDEAREWLRPQVVEK